jgi:hypothetical protein
MNHGVQLDFVPKRKDAVVRELRDESVIYDKESNRAHCLNRTAAEVWRLCDGRRTVAEIARLLQKPSEPTAAEQTVSITVAKLEHAGLLQGRMPLSVKLILPSRREVVRRTGIAAVALAMPLITSMLVPAPAEAASCVPCGQLCILGGQHCCTGCTCSIVGINLICH